MKGSTMLMTRRALMASAIATSFPKPLLANEEPLTGFYMPLESDPHARTFLQWPVSEAVYGARLLQRVQASIAEIAKAIAKFEEVVVLVSQDNRAEAAQALGGSVQTWDIATDDLWCRDSGPTFVRNVEGEFAISHIRFNGWGNKQDHGNDGLIAGKISNRMGLPLLDTGLVGEQGGLEHDGSGLVMAHASSWVNPNRNTGTQGEIGAKILASIGGKKMIWAPGIAGADITDYHIDALARFVGPGKVVIQVPPSIDTDDPWSKAAYETLEILKSATTLDGKPLDIVYLPEPSNIRSRKKDFVASYVNFYVCNGAVICSEFGDAATDGQARDVLQQLYPGRSIVSLNTDPIGESGGGIHCATQQQPMGVA